MDVSKILEGNKNKIGYKLGDATQELDPDFDYTQKACLQFRGNKNGIRAKLGVLPSHDNNNAVQMTEPTVKNTSQHNHNEMVTHVGKVNAYHELSCMQNTASDETLSLLQVSPHFTFHLFQKSATTWTFQNGSPYKKL